MTITVLNGALCAQSDPEAWFVEAEGSTAIVRSICAQCTVREQCLELALTLESGWGVYRHGIWGGTTPGERDVIARQRRAAV